LNDREPIICTPENAVDTCIKAEIRYLAIGDWLVDFQAEIAAAEDNSLAENQLWISSVALITTDEFLQGVGTGDQCSVRRGLMAGSVAAAPAVCEPPEEVLRQPLELTFRSR
jgi:hypothetical protein